MSQSPLLALVQAPSTSVNKLYEAFDRLRFNWRRPNDVLLELQIAESDYVIVSWLLPVSSTSTEFYMTLGELAMTATRHFFDINAITVGEADENQSTIRMILRVREGTSAPVASGPETLRSGAQTKLLVD